MNHSDESVSTLARWIGESRRAVFFGGAGVSTESHIPDFRSVDGLYHQRYAYPPETILSHSFFMQQPEAFYRFYRDKMLFPNALPNAAHVALARWEAQGHIACIVTQNIDGLHQAAGSKNVCELHGSVHRNACTRCGRFYSLSEVMAQTGVPRCTCGGIITVSYTHLDVYKRQGMSSRAYRKREAHPNRPNHFAAHSSPPAAGFARG